MVSSISYDALFKLLYGKCCIFILPHGSCSSHSGSQIFKIIRCWDQNIRQFLMKVCTTFVIICSVTKVLKRMCVHKHVGMIRICDTDIESVKAKWYLSLTVNLDLDYDDGCQIWYSVIQITMQNDMHQYYKSFHIVRGEVEHLCWSVHLVSTYLIGLWTHGE